MTIRKKDCWIDMNQGESNGRNAFGYIGNKERVCGWFFDYSNESAEVRSTAEIEKIIETLNQDETEKHLDALPYSWAEQLLRKKLEDKLSRYTSALENRRD